MSERMNKLLNRQAKAYGLPKSVLRKIRKIKQNYNLNLTDTLFLVDMAADRDWETYS